MTNIGIAVNPSKDSEGSILDKVMSNIKEVFTDVKIHIYDSYSLANLKMKEKLDLLIVLGGDGTLLGVARDINGKFDVPLLGINIGNLGFLSSIEINDTDEAFKKIKNGEYTIQERILLECEATEAEDTNLRKALNDIVIARGTLSRMARFKVFIDDRLYYTFKGDGLIIATPTGSTAYSFSAGGPFIYPDVDVITVTPICPHTKGMQTIVLNSNSEIKIKAENENGEVFLTFDGQESLEKIDESIIKVRKTNEKVKIIIFNDYDYFKVLRKKILNNSEECEGD